MRRLLFATALLGLVGVLVAGCWDSSAVEHPNGAECGQGYYYDPYGYDYSDDVNTACEGGACIVFSENKQNMSGMCSQDCTVDSECTAHERCLTVNLSTGTQGNFCFRTCATDDDCYDSFVCRLLVVGDQHRYCFVDPA